jgi:hypothetical protein
MTGKLLCLTGAVIALGLAADQATLDRGQKEEKVACLPCQSLRLIHSQRLSRATWDKELTKMAGWGVKYSDRDAILEFLVANYGDDKPLVPDGMSLDGTKKK